jgi:hypothetical protein
MPAELRLFIAPYFPKVTGELLPGKFFLQAYTLTIKIHQLFTLHRNFPLDKNKIFQYYACILYTKTGMRHEARGTRIFFAEMLIHEPRTSHLDP